MTRSIPLAVEPSTPHASRPLDDDHPHDECGV